MSQHLQETDCEYLIYTDEKKEWHKNGELHRENDKPAVICYNGTKKWYINGKLHRENDLPAIETCYGHKEWYKNGELHRENDKPAVEYANGDKTWYKHDRIHRENGPAIEKSDGTKRWFVNGIRMDEIVIKVCKKRINNHKIRKLLKLRKNELFWQWYFHPNNIGGKLAIKRMKDSFKELQ